MFNSLVNFFTLLVLCSGKEYNILEQIKIDRHDYSTPTHLFTAAEGNFQGYLSLPSPNITQLTLSMKLRYTNTINLEQFYIIIYGEQFYLGIHQKFSEGQIYSCVGTANECLEGIIPAQQFFDGKWHTLILSYNQGEVFGVVDCDVRKNYQDYIKYFHVDNSELDYLLGMDTNDIETSIEFESLKIYIGEHFIDDNCQIHDISNKPVETLGMQDQIEREMKGEKGDKGDSGLTGKIGERGIPGDSGGGEKISLLSQIDKIELKEIMLEVLRELFFPPSIDENEMNLLDNNDD